MAGMEFNGMSMIVVTPPAAAALVADAKPSHSVRPGSLTCTWVSTSPGISVSSSASSTVEAAASSLPSGSIATILPSRMPTSRATTPAVVQICRPRITKSSSACGSPRSAPRGDSTRWSGWLWRYSSICWRTCSGSLTLRRPLRSGSAICVADQQKPATPTQASSAVALPLRWIVASIRPYGRSAA